jgi:hypothetical protein
LFLRCDSLTSQSRNLQFRPNLMCHPRFTGTFPCGRSLPSFTNTT